MQCLPLGRSALYCSLALFLQIAILSSIAAASVQSDCDLAAEDLRREQAKLKDTANPPDLEDTFQRLKHITDICPNLADAWYFRGRVEQRLGKPADYSLEKARRLNSPALKNNIDPFSPDATSNISGQPPTIGKDSSAPQITILSPAVTREQVVKVKTCNITLKGRVTDESQIGEVEINGAPVKLDGKNEFSTNLTLRPGDNRIFATATDIHGNKAREEFGIICETASPPPTIAGSSSSSPSYTAGKQYALVIGINEYQKLPKLQTAVNDAKEVARVLEEEFGFEVKLLLDADATRSKIIDALEAYQATLQESDRLLIYYAGHGFNDTTVKKAYWQPVDATQSRSGWISADDITTNLTGIEKAQQILVVSDSCYSGELARSSGIRPTAPVYTLSERSKFLERTAKEKSRVLIASGGNEPVADGGGGSHSIFAAKFLLGLREMDLNPFTANELFNAYISVSVSGNSDQLPKLGALLSAGHKGGDFIFARRK